MRTKQKFLWFFIFIAGSMLAGGGVGLTAEKSIILLEVPFTSQAPLAHWQDLRQEDGCEEASTLMALAWVNNKNITPRQAEKDIIAISEYERKKYGGFKDTSAQDTVKRIIKDYFNYANATSTTITSVNEIIKQLQAGNLVIVPVNGQKLKNPYYTPPGPVRHMLLIKGYDYGKAEFITNDSGTRRGNNYRYKADVLFKALRDYLTGDKKPIKEVKKMMIVIKPK